MEFTISRSPIARGRSGQKQSCCGRDKARQARVARREIQGASERVSCSVQPNTIRPSKRAGRVVVPKEMGCVVLADWVQKAPQHRSAVRTWERCLGNGFTIFAIEAITYSLSPASIAIQLHLIRLFFCLVLRQIRGARRLFS